MRAASSAEATTPHCVPRVRTFARFWTKLAQGNSISHRQHFESRFHLAEPLDITGRAAAILKNACSGSSWPPKPEERQTLIVHLSCLDKKFLAPSARGILFARSGNSGTQADLSANPAASLRPRILSGLRGSPALRRLTERPAKKIREKPGQLALTFCQRRDFR